MPKTPNDGNVKNMTSHQHIHAGRDYFEHVAGDVNITYTDGAPTTNPALLLDSYLFGLIRKAGYVPLVDIDPQMAAAEPESRLNLDAIYTALLTVSPEESDRFSKESMPPETQKRLLSALAQVNRHQHVAILGGPGSGKSTFVNFVTLCLAGEWLRRQDINLNLLTAPLPDVDEQENKIPQPWQHGMLLPVCVTLRDFAATGLPDDQEPVTGQHLWQYIANELEREGLGEFVPHLKGYLLEHGGILFLDGLDEVSETDQVRPQIKQVIESCTCLFPHCRIIVTSRTYAYQRRDWKLAGFAETVLATFTDAQIRAFVQHWYRFIAPLRNLTESHALAQAEELTTKIFANLRLRELAERPILLTLMTSLHASRGKLPEKRVELYQETVNLLLHRWEWQKLKHPNAQGNLITTYKSVLQWLDADRETVLKFLGQLAYEAHRAQPSQQEDTAPIDEAKLVMGLWRLKKAHNVTVEQLTTHLRDRAGLLISPDEGVYTFPHRSFQEYLAAWYLAGDQDYPDNIADLFRSDPNRWREVLLLAAASVANAGPMIWVLVDALCFQAVADGEVTSQDAWGALLAGQALVETTDLHKIASRNQSKIQRVRDWLTAILIECVPQDAPFPAVERALAGNILAQLGDSRPGVGTSADGLPDILWCEAPAGTFLMGSNDDDDEKPPHTVHVSAFQISRYPVTNAQYRAFIVDGGYSERTYWTNEGWKWKEQEQISEPDWAGGAFDLANHPVVGVSWYEATAFCRWLTRRFQENGDLPENQEIRLPTEAEWEKAARGTDGRTYPWGEDIDPEHANYSDTGLGVTSMVGCFPRGKSPYHCEEMAGNVWEWCGDWYGSDYYAQSSKENPTGPESGSYRVFRGGYWGCVAEVCRAADGKRARSRRSAAARRAARKILRNTGDSVVCWCEFLR